MKFRKYFVENNGIKARVSYNLDNRIDGQKCVTIYAKDYCGELGKVFSEYKESYKNDSDMMTDYFDKGRVNLFEGHPLYKEARTFVETLRRK